MTRIEAERRRRGWNQTELGYHAKLSQSDVSRIERRRMIPTETQVARISHALGLPSDELLAEAREVEREVERVAV